MISNMEEEKIVHFKPEDLEKCLIDCEISNKQLELLRNSGIRDIKGLVKSKIIEEFARYATEKFLDSYKY